MLNPTLFTASFWFDTTPPPLSAGADRLLFGLFGVVLILGVIVRLVAKHHSKDDKHLLRGFKRAGTMFLTMGVVGLVLFFFSFEQIIFFGARFWYPLWAIGLLV